MDVKVTGIEDVNQILGDMALREAKNILRSTVQDIAGQGADVARTYTPDNPSTGIGDLKSSIRAKRERGTANRIESTIIVGNIRRNYFWRFLEYGQGPDRVQHAMFGKTLMWFRTNIDRVYLDAFGRKLVARLVRLRKKAGG